MYDDLSNKIGFWAIAVILCCVAVMATALTVTFVWKLL